MKKIVDTYRTAEDADKYARLVDYSEIKENDYNLNIARYIDTSEPEPIVDIKAVRSKIKELENKEIEIDKKLAGFLEELVL